MIHRRLAQTLDVSIAITQSMATTVSIARVITANSKHGHSEHRRHSQHSHNSEYSHSEHSHSKGSKHGAWL